MEDKAKERILKIQKSQELLQEAVGRLDRILYERILEKIEAITQDPSEIERIFREFSKADHVKVIRQFASGIMAIGSMNADYFAAVAEDLDSKDYGKFKKQVDSTILERFGLDKDGKIKEGYYLDSFINDTSIPRSVREYGYKAQASGLGYEEVKKGFKDLILGEKGDSGLYKNYYRTYAFDTYQQVDAAVQEAYSEKLGLKAFMYLGGVMDTSRDFCEYRNGKVFLKEEVEKWKKLKFQGNPKNYNPFLDRGGYNCRHHLNYITNQMAAERRSDLYVDEDGNLQKGQKPASGEPETKAKATEAKKDETPATGFQAAKNLDEALKFITDRKIANSYDIGSAKLDQINIINEAAAMVHDKYRVEPLHKLRIGEIKGDPAGAYIRFGNAERRDLAISQKHLDDTVVKGGADYYERVRKNLDEFEAVKAKKPELFAGNTEVSRKNLAKLEQLQEASKYNRYTVGVNHDKKATVIHEFGHRLQDELIRLDDKSRKITSRISEMEAEALYNKWQALYDNSKKNGDIYRISQYAAANSKELFAESFTMLMLEPENLPKNIKELLIEILSHATR